jgi:cytochrome c oxidase subunit 4
MAQHLVSRRTYYQVFAALLGLTGITVAVAFLNLGPLNTLVALTIAVVKALLVVLIFMHVRYSSRLTGVVVAGGVFWLLLLIALTMSDYLTRSWLPVIGW